MGGVCCFVAQQVAIGTGLKEALVGVVRAFADRECDRAVRIAFFNVGDQAAQACVRIIRVFAALEHKGAEADLVAFLTAGQDGGVR